MLTTHVPYCGQAPLPGGAVWNLDPALIAVLSLWLASYLAMHGVRSGKTTAFAAGWSICCAALISPLCNLGVALFSARVSQHMILTLIAAPLVAYGYWGFGDPPRSWRDAALATAAFAFALWFWHAPVDYDATFTSDTAYWAMHVSLFVTATWLWRTLLDPRNLAAALFASFATGAQMCALGALVTLAPRALYAAHALTTGAWGLSPLADQQLGGLIMWIPGGVIFTCHALWALFAGIETSGVARPLENMELAWTGSLVGTGIIPKTHIASSRLPVRVRRAVIPQAATSKRLTTLGRERTFERAASMPASQWPASLERQLPSTPPRFLETPASAKILLAPAPGRCGGRSGCKWTDRVL